MGVCQIDRTAQGHESTMYHGEHIQLHFQLSSCESKILHMKSFCYIRNVLSTTSRLFKKLPHATTAAGNHTGHTSNVHK
jgi:hypothetical protein